MQPIYWFVTELSPRNAGYRVRTLPIVSALRKKGLTVELLPVSEMPERMPDMVKDARAVVVSKPSDTLTYLCLKHLDQAKVPVVIDLFDNYFSWSPALTKRQLHWQWLRSLNCASVVISSSDYLARVIGSLTDRRVVVVSDLIPRQPAASQGVNSAKWPVKHQVEILWFGIPENPYFTAGLEDLASWGDSILSLAKKVSPQCNVRLTICTNRIPSLDVVLGELRRREIHSRFVEWTEETCAALLAKSHLVLLPTNLSGFSLSKTHNRCSDALAQRCLVLSSPNGPYFDIPGAVFRDLDELAVPLVKADASEIEALINQSFGHLSRCHDLEADTERLRTAFDEVKTQSRRGPRGSPPQTSRALIAARTKTDTVNRARSLGYLVCGFANNVLKLDYDVCLEAVRESGAQVCLVLSEPAYELVVQQLAMQRDLDVADFYDGIDCRSASWHLRLERGARRIVIHRGLDPQLEQELVAAQLFGRRTNSTIGDWYAKHVEVLALLLRRLGFDEIDLATEDESGWEKFAEIAEPRLAALGARLRERWVEYEGNELRWGRPAVTAT